MLMHIAVEAWEAQNISIRFILSIGMDVDKRLKFVAKVVENLHLQKIYREREEDKATSGRS